MGDMRSGRGDLEGSRAILADRYHENREGTTVVRMERGTGKKWKEIMWILP